MALRLEIWEYTSGVDTVGDNKQEIEPRLLRITQKYAHTPCRSHPKFLGTQ